MKSVGLNELTVLSWTKLIFLSKHTRTRPQVMFGLCFEPLFGTNWEWIVSSLNRTRNRPGELERARPDCCEPDCSRECCYPNSFECLIIELIVQIPFKVGFNPQWRGGVHSNCKQPASFIAVVARLEPLDATFDFLSDLLASCLASSLVSSLARQIW